MQPSARQLIMAAIAAAGRTARVSRAFGVSAGTVGNWARSGRMPAEKIHGLCNLGGMAVRPEAILEAIAREADPIKQGDDEVDSKSRLHRLAVQRGEIA
jgi:transposase-like protein